MTVRRAGPDDHGVLVSLEAALFTDAWSESSIQPYAAQGPACGQAERIAWLAGRDLPTGYVLYSRVLEDATVERIGVLPEHRRRGVATLLLVHCIEHARRRGVERLWLEVAASNSAARALYESIGFSVEGRRKGYYRTEPPEDALIMCLELSTPTEVHP